MVELGWLNVIGVEPIYVCLADHKLLPDAQAEGWDGFWSSTTLPFGPPKPEPTTLGMRLVASVELNDDGKRAYMTVSCDDDAQLLEEIARAIVDRAGARHSQTIRPGMKRIDLFDDSGTAVASATGRDAAPDGG